MCCYAFVSFFPLFWIIVTRILCLRPSSIALLSRNCIFGWHASFTAIAAFFLPRAAASFFLQIRKHLWCGKVISDGVEGKQGMATEHLGQKALSAPPSLRPSSIIHFPHSPRVPTQRPSSRLVGPNFSSISSTFPLFIFFLHFPSPKCSSLGEE